MLGFMSQERRRFTKLALNLMDFVSPNFKIHESLVVVAGFREARFGDSRKLL